MSLFLKYLSVFFISMVPLLELRGAIPIAIGMGLDTMASILVCAVGNLVPVPVIYLFARKVLLWGLDKPYIGGFCRFCHGKGEGAGRKLAEVEVVVAVRGDFMPRVERGDFGSRDVALAAEAPRRDVEGAAETVPVEGGDEAAVFDAGVVVGEGDGLATPARIGEVEFHRVKVGG